jgi:phosphate transport system substrate-binding protein
MNRRSITAGLLLTALVPFLGACSKKESSSPSPAETTANPKAPETIALTGAGATFPYPLYSKWMAKYHDLHPNVQINYQSIGSGGGIRQITARTVDFGASDAPMTEDESKKAPAALIHIPTTIGAVVVTYNVDGVSSPLKFSSDVLADIYLGKVTHWNDKRIAADNPDAKLPKSDISVVYRSDGSGTTAVFTDYLAKVSPEFKSSVGSGKSVKWPRGLGAKGNEGVTGQIKTTPNTLGYVELAYALQNKMPTAHLKNKAGNFIGPSIASVAAAAAGVELPDSLTASITDGPGADAYPIASYTYLLVYSDAADQKKGATLVDFLWWAIHDGQKECAPLDYAPLPAPVATKVEAKIKQLKVAGKPALAEL